MKDRTTLSHSKVGDTSILLVLGKDTYIVSCWKEGSNATVDVGVTDYDKAVEKYMDTVRELIQMPDKFEVSLQRWLRQAQQIVNAGYADSPPWSVPHLNMSRGRRYIRVISQRSDGSGRCAFCFIDMETGNVLKADNWKRPAKYARGSIYHEDRPGVGKYGAEYLG